jgi:hypothetical protein
MGTRKRLLVDGVRDDELIRSFQLHRYPLAPKFSAAIAVHFSTPVAGCDLIVCWNHNWENCPLEVLELKKAISIQ